MVAIKNRVQRLRPSHNVQLEINCTSAPKEGKVYVVGIMVLCRPMQPRFAYCFAYFFLLLILKMRGGYFPGNHFL